MKKIVILFSVLTTCHAFAQGVLINEIYGAGGNAGALFKNDYVELYNSGTIQVVLAGWSLQYASATSTGTWQVAALSGVIDPGKHYLLQLAAGAGNGQTLPIPDASGSIAMSATAGKVTLVNSMTALTGMCPLGVQIIDRVGYGSSANCFEGSGPTGTPSATLAVVRVVDGLDSNDNAADFDAATPSPQNGQLLPQVITFIALGDRQYGAEPFDLQATSSSGLVVTFTSSNSEVASMEGALASIHSAGETVLTAHQGGSAAFEPAPDQVQVLRVLKVPLTVTAADISKTYGEAIPALELKYSGFVGLENTSVLDVVPSPATSATTFSDAGSYDLVPSGGSDNNYDFAYENGTLTISKAELMAKAEDKTKLWGEPMPIYSIGYSGFKGTDTEASLDSPPVASSPADELSPPGEYEITLSAGTDKNYVYTLVPGRLTVTNPPGLPEVYITTPAHGSTGEPLTARLTAKAVSRAVLYSIQLSVSPDFANFAEKNGGRTQTFSGLTYSTRYFMRVRTNLGSAFGRTTYFTTGPPEQFTFVISPSATAAGVLLSPTLTASLVAGATTYTIEVNTDSEFAGVSQVRSGSRSQKFSGLSLSTTYFTRVKTDLSSSWGPTRSFATGTATNLSYIVSPVNKAVNVTWLPVLKVNDIGMQEYVLQISAMEDFAEAIELAGTSNVFTVTAPLAYDTRYFVRVRNNLSGESWGPVRSFTTGNPPAYAIVTRPANGATNVNYPTNLMSNPVPGASEYTIALNTDHDFDQDSEILRISSSRSMTFTLSPGTLYYTRVKTDLSENWGAVGSFTTGDPQSLAYIIQPAQAAVNVNFEATVTSQTISGASLYTIELNTNPDFSGMSYVKTALARSLRFPLEQNQTYYARVKTDLSPDWGTTIRSFTTGSATSLAFVTIPKSGSTGVPTDVKVYSNPVGNANQYTIELNTASDFSGPGIAKSANVRMIFFDGLFPATTYFARVQTNLAADQWGEVRSFTTVANIGTQTTARLGAVESDNSEFQVVEMDRVESTVNPQLIPYPNPFSSTFTLQLKTDEKRGFVRIVDLLGRQVFAEDLDLGERNQLGARLSSGTYIIQVIQSRRVLFGKVVKE